MLPPALIARLGLRWRSVQRATLADGSMCVFQVLVGKVLWDGKWRRALVDEANTDRLVGMRLVRGRAGSAPAAECALVAGEGHVTVQDALGGQ